MKPAARSLDNSLPVAQYFFWLKHRGPCLSSLEPSLMFSLCSATSQETPGISAGIQVNMSLFHRRKWTRLLYYLGSKLASICTVLAGSSASICTALASSASLKVSDVEGLAGVRRAKGTQRLSTLNSVAMTAEAASLMLSCSQSSTCCVLASTVITPVGLGILSLR
jgi:hypothetical protein